MDVFELRETLVRDYARYVQSFLDIRDERIRERVDEEVAAGLLWPEPLIQLNPSFQPARTIDDLVEAGVLHHLCAQIFRTKKNETSGVGLPLRLYRHQEEAVLKAAEGRNYVLTTGTGSGKSLAYIIPIVDHVLRVGNGGGIKAIIVYPMNALANSQREELEKFLVAGHGQHRSPISFARYTGQERSDERERILNNPPDILLTNFVMLELILTRVYERKLIDAASGLKFLVLDELHTYRGRQGADVAMLVRRVREYTGATDLQYVGTSATLAAKGVPEEQRREIASVASTIFGAPVSADDVIGEALQRVTKPWDETSVEFKDALRVRLSNPKSKAPENFGSFACDPLAAWVESAFGVCLEESSGRFVRATPQSILARDGEDVGVADRLSQLTGVDVSRCEQAVRETLLAGAQCRRGDRASEDIPTFAFRLHQFISRGDNVYATLEPENSRQITVYGQQFAPGDRSRALLPLVFCRECGQEYFSVRRQWDPDANTFRYIPRDLSDQHSDAEEGDAGFLYYSSTNPWPSDRQSQVERLPDDWLDASHGTLDVKRSRRMYLPEVVTVATDGTESSDGLEFAWIPAPFRFCQCCSISYTMRLRSDLTKLTALGTGGRSTATTILALKTILTMRGQEVPEEDGAPAKLLSFTDNRQDASLQAGHFNDFVQVGLLRGALYRAVSDTPEGITHDKLTLRVFQVLALPIEEYSQNPNLRFQARYRVDSALRDVLGYRLYHDLRRGWRVTSPNLEQCGLLRIEYVSLDELCEDDETWSEFHPALATAHPKTRWEIAKTLLDYMRRELAIRVEYLDAAEQEALKQRSYANLIDPWALDPNDRLEESRTVYPRPGRPSDSILSRPVSSRGGFGLYLRRPRTFPDYLDRLSLDETEKIIGELLKALTIAGICQIAQEARNADDVPGYQIDAGAMIWRAGDGETPYHDPIRVPSAPELKGRINPFFRDFYKNVAMLCNGVEAREHTAQVPADEREERERRFRENELPILFCSPTMELGVDIAELNVVNMRNIPPTPANYAQRSGRAGRGGQPALVFSYCAGGSPHDQYFFKRPEQMVAGAVVPPRLDMGNEDLIRSHVHSIWLTETGMSLERSLSDLLDLNSETLDLLPSIRDQVENPHARNRALERAKRVLESISEVLRDTDWYTDAWLEEEISRIPRRFEDTCARWRTLYRSALRQQRAQNAIILDASRPAGDKERARALRREAEAQLRLLTETDDAAYQSDFYSYRYFASEGFLPGYNFPRLPLSAYVPGRQNTKARDSFLSRPRFLAISEFGPRALIYHEGARYRIEKVIIPAEARGEDEYLNTRSIKLCPACGCLHPIEEEPGPDVCSRCGQELGAATRQLFRLENVSTRRRDRITSDEEERFRLGYDLLTGFRFTERGDTLSARTARVLNGDKEIATISYGHAATLWRINLGWRRRKNKNELGFRLDLERGYWDPKDLSEQEEDDVEVSQRAQRVIPYVEDRRNCLLFEPHAALDKAQFASLQAGLKTAIQIVFQLEDAEIAAEPLPTSEDRRSLLFYEAAEGGAGVLRRIVDEPVAFREVARVALGLCHFDPDTGDDRGKADGAREECTAACYDCLMSYTNQLDHPLLDRHSIRDLLITLATSYVAVSPSERSRSDHLEYLLQKAGSQLERRWLRWANDHELRLPTDAQVLIEACNTRPDFLYADDQVVVYIDGPPHDYPERRARDVEQTERLEDYGYTVVRFRSEDDWNRIVEAYPYVFGGLE